MEKKNDKRVQRTEKAVFDALCELLLEKKLSKITVSELCKKAGINRNTFYSHYQIPADVLEPIVKKFYDTFNETIVEHSLDEKRMVNYLRFIKENKDLVKPLFSPNCDIDIMSKIQPLGEANAILSIELEHKRLSPQMREYLLCFTLSACSAVASQWIQNGMVESPEEISEFLVNACNYGAFSL